MNKILYALLLLLGVQTASGQVLPKPDHLVIILEENRDYTDIVGSHLAPYINSLLADTNTAYFTNAYALVSGSQPNYLMLFSGSDQGVSGSTITSTQFTTCNLGAELLNNGETFIGYAEDLPGVGDLSITSGNYARKHNPWSNWQGTGTNQLPPSTNVPFSYFPSNFDSLPTVSFVVPNLIDDMHTPSDSTSIGPGDTWLHDKLNSYIQWSKTHNSMLLFAFDESSQDLVQHILVFFVGQGVKGGAYGESVDWYKLLHTIEQMYSLPYCANAATSSSILDIWSQYRTSVSEPAMINGGLRIWPVPADGPVHVALDGAAGISHLSVYDCLGREVIRQTSDGQFTFDTDNMVPGVYQVSVSAVNLTVTGKMVVSH